MACENIALESVTEKCDRRTDRQTDGQRTDKVIPMCRYASQATQKVRLAKNFEEIFFYSFTYLALKNVPESVPEFCSICPQKYRCL